MIKFRAWDNLLNKMLVVYRISFDGPVDGVQVHCYLDDRGAEGSTEYAYDGDGLILEQFTGLKDVNDKEIYIGDIVKYRNLEEKYQYLKIRWLQQDCMVDAGGYRIDIVVRRCEVIGNVHENAELLEE